MSREPLNQDILNNWVSNPQSTTRLEAAKQKQLETALKRSLKKLDEETNFFTITEEDMEILVAEQPKLPSDNELEEIKKLYKDKDLLEASLDAQIEEITSLENQLSVYRSMTLWERLKFVFLGR